MRVQKVADFVELYGGLQYAADKARKFAVEAKERIAGFSDSPSKKALVGFADFVVEREK